MDVSDIVPSLEQVVALKQQRAVEETALRTLFAEARTANGFLTAPVYRDDLLKAVDLAQLGPTSANTQPVRYVINIGYGDDTKSFPRLPRLSADEISAFA
jgi:hypothetical protein